MPSHRLLSPDATWTVIRQIEEDAILIRPRGTLLWRNQAHGPDVSFWPVSAAAAPPPMHCMDAMAQLSAPLRVQVLTHILNGQSSR